ncbi:hypothetical protein Pla108_37130 [Botrimarina colliarenosi]|uniref:Uncharacterized protein n=1 Tax=Botrimarina colliarenosi TaxID=2528001 RepID=A0A5C6A4J0_9BACT|nr:hypothetical protein [Botrimarina colliarenosi]TWT94862.1 hypothetical protein Pla108_37130 [Botrimarina colliarenosi]
MISRDELRTALIGSAAALFLNGISWIVWLTSGDSDSGFDVFSMLSLLVVGAGMALLRLLRKHPVINVRYGQWLQGAPWRWPERLPFGRPEPGIADALVLILFVALSSINLTTSLLMAAAAYSATYFLLSTATALRHREPLLLGAIVVLAGLAIAGSAGWSRPTLWPFLMALFAGLLISIVSLKRLLTRFDTLDLSFSPMKRVATSDPAARTAGSPLRELLVTPPTSPPLFGWWAPSVTVLWLFACAQYACQGWMAWADRTDFGSLVLDGDAESMFQIFVYLAMRPEVSDPAAGTFNPLLFGLTVGFFVLLVVVGWTLFRRVHQHWPPMNPLGRIATGRLILPGYDYVFVGALTALVTYFAIAGMLIYAPLGLLAGGIALTVALQVFCRLTPSQAVWSHTGRHRILCLPSRPVRQTRS